MLWTICQEKYLPNKEANAEKYLLRKVANTVHVKHQRKILNAVKYNRKVTNAAKYLPTNVSNAAKYLPTNVANALFTTTELMLGTASIFWRLHPRVSERYVSYQFLYDFIPLKKQQPVSRRNTSCKCNLRRDTQTQSKLQRTATAFTLFKLGIFQGFQKRHAIFTLLYGFIQAAGIT